MLVYWSVLFGGVRISSQSTVSRESCSFVFEDSKSLVRRCVYQFRGSMELADPCRYQSWVKFCEDSLAPNIFWGNKLEWQVGIPKRKDANMAKLSASSRLTSQYVIAGSKWKWPLFVNQRCIDRCIHHTQCAVCILKKNIYECIYSSTVVLNNCLASPCMLHSSQSNTKWNFNFPMVVRDCTTQYIRI